LSFATIFGVGPNAAIIHYKPEKATAAKLDVNKIFLLDSGAQYRDGTTDITRTVHFGKPTDFEREAFTRVLQGHIALDCAKFPSGTTGFLLDPLARLPLWKGGLNYRHGTGHGVGAFLNVHEGPHGIGTRISYNDTALQVGMTVSNEPGYYEDGYFGIRIENILIVKDVKLEHNFGDVGYLGFEHITLVPIDRKLINTSMLSAQELDWINQYHAEIYDKVSPHLAPGSLGLGWLKKETSLISIGH